MKPESESSSSSLDVASVIAMDDSDAPSFDCAEVVGSFIQLFSGDIAVVIVAVSTGDILDVTNIMILDPMLLLLLPTLLLFLLFYATFYFSMSCDLLC